VPSWSVGFWVAITKNGRGSMRVSPSTVTCCSSIASSSALCVFGPARLISSASSTCAKTGPGMEHERLLAALVDADPDQVGRHQVGGKLRPRKTQTERDRQRVRQRRLADPRNVLDQQVATGQQAGHAVLDLRPLADDDRANLVDQLGQPGRKGFAHAAPYSKTTKVPGS
jgi:hypothetical protein